MEVQAARWVNIASALQQSIGLLRHTIDHPLLAVTEVITLVMGLLPKVLVDYPTARSGLRRSGESLAENFPQPWPA